jgi:beta-xylosidase
MPASDDFSKPRLGLQWQWNHNPDAAKWSLSARPGSLRLTDQKAPNLANARNTLAQRTLGSEGTATVKIDTSHLQIGDRTGLCLFQEHYGYVAIEKSATDQSVICALNKNDDLTTPDEAVSDTVERFAPTTSWLHAQCDFGANVGQFSYSTDGVRFKPLSAPLPLRFTLKTFQGVRFGLFIFNPAETAGWVDVDEYRQDMRLPH